MIIIIIILYYPKLVNDFVYDLRAFLVGQLFCKGSGGMVPLMETAKHKENKNVTAIYVRLDEANIFW